MEVERPKLSLDILQLSKSAQSANGMRHSEYERYRAYCSRRVHRIRKSVKFTHGRGKFTKRELDANVCRDARHLMLPLFYAERSWSHAMELKQVHHSCVAEDIRGGPHQHSMSRLRKADKWAQHLKTLCDQVGDERTSLEAHAYACWMHGTLMIEAEEWKAAVQQYMEAQAIYENLAKVGSQAEKDLFRGRVEEMAPAIRLCQHELKRSTGNTEDISLLKEMGKVEGMDDMMKAKLDAVLADSLRKQAEDLTEVEHQGQRIPIRGEKVRMGILQSQEAALELDQATDYDARMEAFDKYFGVLNDVVAAIAKEQQDLANKRFGDKEEKEKQLLMLERYINTIRTQRTVERNELIVQDLTSKLQAAQEAQKGPSKKAVKPDELVQMYGRLIQNIEDLQTLDEHDEGSEPQKVLLASLLTFQAFRCFYLAMVFVGRSQWPEAVALYERASNLSLQAVEYHEKCEEPNTTHRGQATELVKRIRGQKCLVQAAAYMDELKAKGSSESSRSDDAAGAPLLDRLQTWNSSVQTTNVIEFPPAFEAVPCKPIFFDLAFNYVQFPDMSEYEQKKGMLGRLGGMFGWGK